MSRLIASTGFWLVAFGAGWMTLAQQPQLLTPNPGPPLFFREEWRQTGAFAAPDFRPQHPLTPAAVTNASLVLTVHDPGAVNVKSHEANPPERSLARDWRGPTCVQMSGYSQNPPPRGSSPANPPIRPTCGQASA